MNCGNLCKGTHRPVDLATSLVDGLVACPVCDGQFRPPALARGRKCEKSPSGFYIPKHRGKS